MAQKVNKPQNKGSSLPFSEPALALRSIPPRVGSGHRCRTNSRRWELGGDELWCLGEGGKIFPSLAKSWVKRWKEMILTSSSDSHKETGSAWSAGGSRKTQKEKQQLCHNQEEKLQKTPPGKSWQEKRWCKNMVVTAHSVYTAKGEVKSQFTRFGSQVHLRSQQQSGQLKETNPQNHNISRYILFWHRKITFRLRWGWSYMTEAIHNSNTYLGLQTSNTVVSGL